MIEAALMHVTELDHDGRRVDGYAQADSLLQDIGEYGLTKTIAIALVAFLSIAIGRWFYQRKRRYGYDQVPVELVI